MNNNSASTSKGDILIVDDTPDNLNLLVSILAEKGYEVRAAISGPLALRTVRTAPPELILLDINMPDMNGLEVCSQLKANEKTQAIPIIFLSALDETEDKVKAFQAGGVDYISKPFQVEEVLVRVQSQLTLYRQRREIEELRQRERDHFENHNRLKDQFLLTASHDLKSPISIIKSYLEMLEEQLVQKDEQVQHLFGTINRRVDQMLELIHNLLDLNRIEASMVIELEPILLGSLVKEVTADFKAQARRKDIEVALVPPNRSVWVRLDPVRFQQVLANLLSNAIKYTLPGGRIEVRVEIEDERANIQVKDTGLGIPKGDLPRIFEKFYRVERKESPAVEGSGLGLAIVKSIVEKHGGQVWVESAESEGTTFTIGLPLLRL